MLYQLQPCMFASFEKMALEKSQSQTSDRQLWKMSALSKWLNTRIKVYFVMMKYLIFNEKKTSLLMDFTCSVIYVSHELVTRLFMCEYIGIVYANNSMGKK